MRTYFRGLFSLIITLSFLSSLFLFCDFSKGEDLEDKPKIPEQSSSQDLITVNFENTDILEVIRILSEKSGLNIVSGPDVKATVNLQLVDVPWEKALDVILRTYNLTYKKEPGLIRVMTLEQLKLEEEKVPLATKIIKMNFSRVDDVKSSFNSMLSARGKIETDNRTNSLIITDLPENIDKIENVAQQLDSRTPQVMIEVMMADVRLTDQDQIGIQWNADIQRHESPETPKTRFAQSLLPASVAGSIIFGQTIGNYFDFTSTFRIWQERKRVNVLAHPVIITLDNQTSHIELTEQIPYTLQTSSTQSAAAVTSTAFKDVGIKLDVTPHVTTKDNFISMNLKVEQSFRSSYTPDNQPVIDARKAETNLLVKDNETIVIGGLRRKDDTFTVDKIPLLGDIPFFGMLFRRKTREVNDVDLLIFVTPRLLIESRLAEKEKKRLELFEPSTEDEKKFEVFEKKKKAIKPKKEEELKKEEIFTLRPPS
ncbi:MAG: secretin N-terminal domain-containing protein [Candidatus Omnitrophota bacterium]|nr:secretin N-terminal domain-containing protein [Candidatus Omnitrophota bacterium]